jgi:outer membrane biosynthesis protein TonB
MLCRFAVRARRVGCGAGQGNFIVRERLIARAQEIKDKGAVVKTVEPQSDTPSPTRLVIRVKIPVENPPPAPVRRPWNKGALLGLLIVVVAGLSWLGFSMFRAEPTSPAPVPSPRAAAPVVSSEPPPKPAPQIEPEVPKQQALPPSPFNEVIPDVSRSARDTIRGTIRVSIRVIVDKDGNVLAATADEPGPSRYFARISLEAARKWIFAPVASEQQRVMLVRFYFKRSGTTARAIPAQ